MARLHFPEQLRDDCESYLGSIAWQLDNIGRYSEDQLANEIESTAMIAKRYDNPAYVLKRLDTMAGRHIGTSGGSKLAELLSSFYRSELAMANGKRHEISSSGDFDLRFDAFIYQIIETIGIESSRKLQRDGIAKRRAAKINIIIVQRHRT